MHVSPVRVPQLQFEATGRALRPEPSGRLAEFAEVAASVPGLSGGDGKALSRVVEEVGETRASMYERAVKAEEARLSGASKSATVLQQLLDEVSSRNGGALSEHDRDILRTLTDTMEGQARLMEESREHLRELQEALGAIRAAGA
ncbi:hypothetical protein LJR164_004657 [Phenylobacterium sp. LjRoot164]|uniref:hypothetical protein n=1 Tax=unclassified Phenylobacterium TaxID=2640670 RepID=UPI003ECCC14C